MKRILAILMACLFMMAVMAVMAMPAFAAITQSKDNGHPNTNPAGKCPTGQNQGATNGALNKCD